MPYPEQFIVSYGASSWILNDGTTGRPIMGAGPFPRYFDTTEEAQDAIEELCKGVHDREHFHIHSTKDDEPTKRDAAAADDYEQACA